MRALWTVLISVLGALTWYRQHLKFQDQRGIFHAISPEYGGWLLLAAVLLGCGTVLVMAWKEAFASRGTAKPGIDKNHDQ